ncbi:MAG: two-component system sensor histidine kinase PhoQ [Oceanicoccus sp.]|jgi:two-component system sensor histidine kinase PhoQ
MVNTLFGRLLIASTLLLSLFFGFMGYIINQLSLDNVYQARQAQLRLQNNMLLAATQIGEKQPIVDEDELREPRFNDYESGVYGFITDEDNNILWKSYSAHSLTFEPTLFESKKREPGSYEYQIYSNYFAYRYTVRWEIETDKPGLYTFTVLEDSGPILSDIEAFQQKLRRWLVAIATTLVVILMLILRLATLPMRRLARSLKQIEKGLKDHIEGDFPIELRGVTNNLNELIDAERNQRERYRNTLADLAHSLKTPLAVIQTQLESKQVADKTSQQLIAEQTRRMDEIIKHQLQRAVVSTQHRLVETINVQQCIQRLVNAMNKVYATKAIIFEQQLDASTYFKGDQRDLMEVLGNLLDNACKACLKQVNISAVNNHLGLLITIEDDGAGIPAQQRQQLIQRGQRADSLNSGQGIGLDVARDIVASYQGQLQIDDSALGGALIDIQFHQDN